MRDSFLRSLFSYAKTNPNVIILTGDLGYGALDVFFRDLPSQIYNLGIAEQSIISISSGMALEGKKVFVYSITNFISLRVVEQIRNDLCYHDLDVTILAIGSGFSYGELGFTHHSTEDIAVIRALPNITIFSPSDQIEVNYFFNEILQLSGPKYIKLDKIAEIYYRNDSKVSMNPKVVKGSGDTLIFTYGSNVGNIINILNRNEIHPDKYRIISTPVIKPLVFDENMIKQIELSRIIITIEEHNLDGGFGSAIMESINDGYISLNFNNLYRIGLRNTFIKEVGKRDYILEKMEFEKQLICLFI